MRSDPQLHSEMSEHIRLWQLSGQSQIAYCREQGLNFTKFNYWVRKLRNPQPEGFIALKVGKTPSSSSALLMELELSGGGRLMFYTLPDAAYLKSILY